MRSRAKNTPSETALKFKKSFSNLIGLEVIKSILGKVLLSSFSFFFLYFLNEYDFKQIPEAKFKIILS